MTELRIVQFFVPNEGGEDYLTRYTIQQKVHGQWTELPVTLQEENDPDILERLGFPEKAADERKKKELLWEMQVFKKHVEELKKTLGKTEND